MSARTCCGDWRETSRSCCKVRSTDECFWKFWSALEGPHRASAMATARYLAIWEEEKVGSKKCAQRRKR